MWDAIKDWIFWVIEQFYYFCGDWGLSIIIVTVIFRIIISPLMHKQTKSSFQMQKVQPRIKEIQAKYKDEPARQQEEMQKLYAEAKFNPLAGCLPMLLQMPIFMALYQVLSNMGDLTSGTAGYSFYNIIPSLVTKPSQAFADGIGTFVPYLVLMIIFAGATFLPMVIQQRGRDNAQQKQTLIMSAVMSAFMLYISWGAPAGVLLFWGASGLMGLAQSQISMSIFRKRDAEAEAIVEVKPIEVDVTRKEKKPRPTKKGK